MLNKLIMDDFIIYTNNSIVRACIFHGIIVASPSCTFEALGNKSKFRHFIDDEY